MTRIVAGMFVAWALLAGCAPKEPMSVSEMFGFCFTENDFSNDSMCTWRNAYCRDLRRAVSRDFESNEECRQACEEVRDRYRLTLQDYGCATFYRDGLDWCRRYCVQNYE